MNGCDLLNNLTTMEKTAENGQYIYQAKKLLCVNILCGVMCDLYCMDHPCNPCFVNSLQ